ncbi:hypothetical protein BN14_04651 [Rhizoctonia solani AG-1 IB]|uniref:Uncharacterized protein n=1 Tax=Thanatephorus cucumeris (strain AG1-IB / isolate 7/3/14) TaxID=1108050 RepID=M5BTS5_THACB|nr:hypothetical protein BN14_04651 [Rhizoctonia solani AG-1 IB]
MSLQQYACRCLNITITSTTPRVNRDAAPTDPTHFEKVHVGDAGVKVSHSQLTLRRRAAAEDQGAKIQWNTVSCLLCRTTVYRVASEVATDFELRDGLVVTPGEEFTESEILRGRDGFIEVNLGPEGCIDAEAISTARNESTKYSETFGLLLPASPKPSTLPSTPQRPSSPQPPATPRSFLPTLPPLFHPPPYSPSHPVFVRLSKTASITSAQYRAQAERAIEAFIEAQVAEVLEKERHLRGQVEVIWSRWRESWKQEADSESPSEGHHPTLSGVVPVREFSPTRVSESGPVSVQGSAAPQAIPTRRTSVHTPGPSMLSQSLRQSNFIPPPQPVASTPSPQFPTPVNGVKNPLDDSHAVSISLQIRSIDASRARESARDVEERRRNRLSLSGKPNTTPVVPEEQSPKDGRHVTTTSRNGVVEGKRKVMFQADVKEEDGGSQPVPRRGSSTDGVDEQTETPDLFDLDDDEEELDQPTAEADQTADATSEEPTTPRAVAQLKAKAKANKESAKIGNKSAVPALLTVNLGPSPAKTKTSLKSPPAVKLESPKTRTARPGEDKLLELVAANYPSHRAAWRPNGKAWELFDARRKFADSPDSASMTSSEDSAGGKWDNPSQFATSLPIGIAAGPLASSAEREPKTSLHNKPGALVPPLRLDCETPRQTRERTYALRDLARSVDPGPVLELQAAEDAEGDTDEEEEADLVGEISNTERIRRRTMRIVQRQSGVPDAGMWRSVAS